MEFNELGLDRKTLKGVVEAGYILPTAIQSQVIPEVLKGHDVFASAQTGSGKTASFALPILVQLEKGRRRAKLPRCLVLSPTRELAYQANETFQILGKHHDLNTAVIIGGESMVLQERQLKKSVDILIATPGRLLDLFERGKLILNAIEMIVLDESDRMLDMGFLPEIERLLKLMPVKHQKMMFSATVPKQIKKLAAQFLVDPVEVKIDPPSKASDNIEQFVCKTSSDGRKKRSELRTLIAQKDIKNAIIFCNRKKDVSTLSGSLNRYKLNAAPLHGDIPQSKRKKTLDAFRSGELNILVASDVAARGIDVESLPFVINFDIPLQVEDYIHRIGRTGRAGSKGCAFTFIGDKEAKALANLEKHLKTKLKECVIDQPKEPKKKVVKKADKAKTEGVQREMPHEGQKGKTRSRRNQKTIIGFGDEIPAFMHIVGQLAEK